MYCCRFFVPDRTCDVEVWVGVTGVGDSNGAADHCRGCSELFSAIESALGTHKILHGASKKGKELIKTDTAKKVS